MTTVFYKDIEKYKWSKNVNVNVNEINYTFLDYLQDYINVNSIYNMLEPYTMKLKNIYQFLYLLSININYTFNEIPKLDNINKTINPDEFNELLLKYIDDNKINSIIILNGILCYLFPPR